MGCNSRDDSMGVDMGRMVFLHILGLMFRKEIE